MRNLLGSPRPLKFRRSWRRRLWIEMMARRLFVHASGQPKPLRATTPESRKELPELAAVWPSGEVNLIPLHRTSPLAGVT